MKIRDRSEDAMLDTNNWPRVWFFSVGETDPRWIQARAEKEAEKYAEMLESEGLVGVRAVWPKCQAFFSSYAAAAEGKAKLEAAGIKCGEDVVLARALPNLKEVDIIKSWGKNNGW